MIGSPEIYGRSGEPSPIQNTMDTTNKKQITQYFSKWRGIWVEFKNQPPGKGEILSMKKSKYKLR